MRIRICNPVLDSMFIDSLFTWKMDHCVPAQMFPILTICGVSSGRPGRQPRWLPRDGRLWGEPGRDGRPHGPGRGRAETRTHRPRHAGHQGSSPTISTRGLQRDVVYLCWPIAPSYYESKCGGRGGVAGPQLMSTAVHITWYGAQINFGDLPPYLTYDLYRFVLSFFRPFSKLF